MKHALRSTTLCSLALLATITSLLFLASCNVHSRKDGEKEKVDIATPFGDLKVRTNETVAKDTGLPEYPGAKLKPAKDDKDDNSANVNLSFGDFGLKVVAVKYTSDDAPEKILSFYRNELKRFGGNVIECKGGSGHGFNIKKKSDGSQEVSCDKDDHEGDSVSLKVGTENNQHVVAVKPDGKGSELTLVYVNARGGEEGKL